MQEVRTKRWEDLEVGHEFDAMRYTVTPQAIASFLNTIREETNVPHSERDLSIVPPALLMTDYTRLLGQVLPPITGMHAHHKMATLRAIPANTPLNLFGVITDKYIRRERKYVVVRYWIEDDDGVRYLQNEITTTIDGYLD